MNQTPARSPSAASALALVQELQAHFDQALRPVSGEGRFSPVSWLRDEGRHGGGTRLTYQGGTAFNRASLNVSQVHYDDQPERPLGSATALSCIVHPAHPLAPSIHLHISWTEMRQGGGYWRVMADLNPAIPDEGDRARFFSAMKQSAGPLFDHGVKQGEAYFYIPALERHRGVAHFYLEQYRTDSPQADQDLAARFGKTMIDCYAAIQRDRFGKLPAPTAEQKKKQLEYHTLYFFQVLTLDRGTTSGLLVHDQNDVGILGSLPAVVDRSLLESWGALVPKPQDELLRALVKELPSDGRVEDEQKRALCQAVRRHYKAHPLALDLQAKGDVVPPTVRNHSGS